MTHIPPSLGTTAIGVWNAWLELPPPGGTFTISGRDVCGGGSYFLRHLILYRQFPFTKKSPATYREATQAEVDDVFDAIDAGVFQIEARPPAGIERRWTHPMAPTVYHQATGRAIPGTPAAARMRDIMLSRPCPEEFTRDADGNLTALELDNSK